MTYEGTPDRSDDSDDRWTDGMPTGRHSPFTPEGEIEQFGKLTGRLVSLSGWRREVARLAVLIVILLAVAATVTTLTFR